MTRRKMKRAGVHLVPSENGWALQRWLSPANLVQRAHRLGTADATTVAVSRCTQRAETVLEPDQAASAVHSLPPTSRRSGSSNSEMVNGLDTNALKPFSMVSSTVSSLLLPVRRTTLERKSVV